MGVTPQPTSPFLYTEDALRSFISDCVSILSQPCCPNVFASTYKEMERWMELLKSVEGDRFLIH